MERWVPVTSDYLFDVLRETEEVNKLKNSLLTKVPGYGCILEQVHRSAHEVTVRVVLCENRNEWTNGYISEHVYSPEGNPWEDAYNSIFDLIEREEKEKS